LNGTVWASARDGHDRAARHSRGMTSEVRISVLIF
jgi:hypothetical protein